MLSLPLCMRDMSSISSTIFDRRSVSSLIIFTPRRVSSLRLSSAIMVSLQPRIAVIGVRSSCEIWDIKSFLTFLTVGQLVCHHVNVAAKLTYLVTRAVIESIGVIEVALGNIERDPVYLTNRQNNGFNKVYSRKKPSVR